MLPLFLLALCTLCVSISAFKGNDSIEYAQPSKKAETYEEAYLACRAVNGTIPVVRENDDVALQRLICKQ